MIRLLTTPLNKYGDSIIPDVELISFLIESALSTKDARQVFCRSVMAVYGINYCVAEGLFIGNEHWLLNIQRHLAVQAKGRYYLRDVNMDIDQIILTLIPISEAE